MSNFKVIKDYPRSFASNSYILTADGKTAIVIDPSEKGIFALCQDNGLECKCALLTHGHFDHIGGCGELNKNGVPIYCGENEKELIFSKEYLSIFGGVKVPDFEIAGTFKDGDEVELCGIKFKVLETPGHTAGSVTYLAGDCLFTGDTLFKGSAGRTDLPTGDFTKILESLKKLSALAGDYKVYCGHEDDTTLENERENNPYLNC